MELHHKYDTQGAEMGIDTLIMLCRQLLRDTDYTDQRISDTDIQERILAVQNDLIAEFNENIHIVRVKASERFELDKEIARIYRITLDGKPIDTALFPSALKRDGLCFTHYGARRYGVVGLQDLENEQDSTARELEICASFYERECVFNLPSPEIVLSERYMRAIALGTLCEFLLIETNQANPQRLQFYKNELESAKNRLRAEKNRALNPNTLESKANA